MFEFLSYLYAGMISIAVITSGIGAFAYLFLVIPYIWYMRFKDRELWLSLGGPWLGVGLFEIVDVLVFLWKKQYKASDVKSVVIMSNILRVIYVKFMVFGGGALVMLILISMEYPEITDWMTEFSNESRKSRINNNSGPLD